MTLDNQNAARLGTLPYCRGSTVGYEYLRNGGSNGDTSHTKPSRERNYVGSFTNTSRMYKLHNHLEKWTAYYASAVFLPALRKRRERSEVLLSSVFRVHRVTETL